MNSASTYSSIITQWFSSSPIRAIIIATVSTSEYAYAEHTDIACATVASGWVFAETSLSTRSEYTGNVAVRSSLYGLSSA